MRVWIYLDLFYEWAESKGESRKLYRFCRECEFQLGYTNNFGYTYPPIQAKLSEPRAYLVSQTCFHTIESEYIPLQFISLTPYINDGFDIADVPF